MSIKAITKRVKDLSKKEIDFMNNQRIKEYGKRAIVDFKKEDKGGIFFFVIDNNKIKAFGMLKPINLIFKGKKYAIMGIGRGMAVQKLKGYGKILGLSRLNYLKKKKKTGIGFTLRKNKGFFEKVGFNVINNFTDRFRYKHPKIGKWVKESEEERGDGICYEGKDKLISKMLKNKSSAYIEGQMW